MGFREDRFCNPYGTCCLRKDFDMRARRSAHVAFMVLFDMDSSYVVHGCWFANKGGEMKSSDFNKIIEFIWFSYDFRKSARAFFL